MTGVKFIKFILLGRMPFEFFTNGSSNLVPIGRLATVSNV